MRVDNDLWNQQFALVSSILATRGYKVTLSPGEEDRVDLNKDSLEVVINSRCWPETRFYTLLHEAGHVMISEDAETFANENPMYVHASAALNDGRRERAKAYRVSLVSEEIEAWKIGKRLAQTMGLYIDDDKYNKHMTESVMTYIEWAAE